MFLLSPVAGGLPSVAYSLNLGDFPDGITVTVDGVPAASIQIVKSGQTVAVSGGWFTVDYIGVGSTVLHGLPRQTPQTIDGIPGADAVAVKPSAGLVS